MSLWLESLGLELGDRGEDLDKRAKCILAYLSMPAPRSWWEGALKTGNIAESYIHILQDLRGELLAIPGLPERLDLGLLVALGFVDDDIEDKELKFANVGNRYSIEDYLSKAKEIFVKRPEVKRLVKKVDKKAHLLA